MVDIEVESDKEAKNRRSSVTAAPVDNQAKGLVLNTYRVIKYVVTIIHYSEA